jgi:hypothetical protein
MKAAGHHRILLDWPKGNFSQHSNDTGANSHSRNNQKYEDSTKDSSGESTCYSANEEYLISCREKEALSRQTIAIPSVRNLLDAVDEMLPYHHENGNINIIQRLN